MAVLERAKGLVVNSLDKTGEAPLHSLVKRERRDRVGVVLALLVHSDADIHLKTPRGATPLHLAVEVREKRDGRDLYCFTEMQEIFSSLPSLMHA